MIIGDGIYVECANCADIAFLPYSSENRDTVVTTQVRDWVTRDGMPWCHNCAYAVDEAIADKFIAMEAAAQPFEDLQESM
jgi:hypothetical protein